MCSAALHAALATHEDSILQAYCCRCAGITDRSIIEEARIKISLQELRELSSMSFAASAQARNQIWSSMRFALDEKLMMTEAARSERSPYGKWVFNTHGPNTVASRARAGANRVIRFPECTYKAQALLLSHFNAYCLRSDPITTVRAVRSRMSYFEVSILKSAPGSTLPGDRTRSNVGSHSGYGLLPCVVIGFSALYKHNRTFTGMPGWTRHALGWHSDDGRFFFGCDNGSPAAQEVAPGVNTTQCVYFGPGDTVGIGLRLNHAVCSEPTATERQSTLYNATVLLTKNGEIAGVRRNLYLGYTWSEFCPCVGIDSRDTVQIHMDKFAFDFAKYEREAFET
ncbi:Ran-binding protein 9 [Hondaea fermentalgiana]|uniref:Ran-binding protein 9 n=1 Tax=Hondaea fermentalgiana TaxID=2315210 RepID=A0A2R5GFZ6_9STRA|nr:Ran-binding protein 9 [Hondaea fermentalgiana]|eukprot:GBG27171.1 Ran-binding protein 9 [Hondaea fermentalgiana]